MYLHWSKYPTFQPRDLDLQVLIESHSLSSFQIKPNQQTLLESWDNAYKLFNETAAIYVGKRLPHASCTERMTDKMRQWEYVDMWELVLE